MITSEWGIKENVNATISICTWRRTYLKWQNNRYGFQSHAWCSFQNGFRRAIRQQLVEASEKDDIKVIEDCIRAFEKNRLEDKGDLTRANEKIELLYLRKSTSLKFPFSWTLNFKLFFGIILFHSKCTKLWVIYRKLHYLPRSRNKLNCLSEFCISPVSFLKRSSPIFSSLNVSH